VVKLIKRYRKMVSTLAARKKRETVSTTYRISPEVKQSISVAASEDARSENSEVEFLIRLGLEYRLIKKNMGQV
jgi:hypothetical protein